MAIRDNRLKIEVKQTEPRRVTLTTERRNSWGTVVERRQVTFSAREFERAIKEANLTVSVDLRTKRPTL